MDRPASRRGRHGSNAESVSVADLLARTTPSEKAFVSAIQERAAIEAAYPTGRGYDLDDTDPAATTDTLPAVVGPVETVVDAPRGSHRLARTIMLATAAMLACGVVAAFSVLTSAAPVRLAPSTPSTAVGQISGPAVVRPDLLSRRLEDGLPSAGRVGPAAAEPVDPAAVRSLGSLQPQDQVRAQRLLDEGPSARLSAGQGAQAEQTRLFVREFFLSMEDHPDEAFAMLGPDMQGDGLDGFVRSWDDVLVEIPQLEGGEGGLVRAVVTISWPRSEKILRTEQLLVVSDGPQRKIVRAELMSAHRG